MENEIAGVYTVRNRDDIHTSAAKAELQRFYWDSAFRTRELEAS